MTANPMSEEERLQRWRLVLGRDAEINVPLIGEMKGMDGALGALYGGSAGGLGRSSPHVARWLGDIRQYFPSSVVRVMQKDALERLQLQQMLLEPELLSSVDADVNLVATLISLNRVIPQRTRETARQVVRKVVEDIEKRLREATVQAVRGALTRAHRNSRPKAREIDWDRTIRKNLRHYQADRHTIIPETLVGFGHKRNSLRDIVLCVDQSGSMASSVVYASVFGAVLASMRAVSTRMAVFDTTVVELTAELQDPVDLLFGAQLGGGTDIANALGWCQQAITRPAQTILVLITDLCEGGSQETMLQRAAAIVRTGVNVICLLALSDQGAPIFDHANAARFTALGIPCFAVTPDQFPGLMAAAIRRQDVGMWAARQGIVTSRGREDG